MARRAPATPAAGDASAPWFRALVGFSLTIPLGLGGNVGQGGAGRKSGGFLAHRLPLPTLLTLGFVSMVTARSTPLPQAEGASVGLCLLILKRLTGCSRSKGTPHPSSG